MFCIAHSSTDPYFNLAAEEYLLRNFSENFFMLWRNKNTIVVGKHQNTLAEINMDYIREKKIRVIRRLTGGGAVFHDLGNLNFTFIMNGQEGHLIDFKKYTLPVLEVLQKLSVDARFHGRSDLTIDGKKISGNAEHVYKKRVLHHGTLLFSSEIGDLYLALKVNPMKYKSTAVKSIRSRVTNICEYLKDGLEVTEFRDLILSHIIKTLPNSGMYKFTGEDIAGINKLKKEKYLTWEWNFGYSPKYHFERSFIANGRNIQLHLAVSNGIIQKARITGDLTDEPRNSDIAGSLEGKRHDMDELLKILKSARFCNYFQDITAEEFTKGLF